MFPRLYPPVLCPRSTLRRYATSLQKPVTQDAAKTKRVSVGKAKVTAVPSSEKEAMSEEEIVQQIENVRFMSKMYPTFDPWGQHVETLGALCPPRMSRFMPYFHKKRRYTTLSYKFCHPVTFSKCSCHVGPVSPKPFERRQERCRVSRCVDINTLTNLLSACGHSLLQMRSLVSIYLGRVVSKNMLQAGHGGCLPQSPQGLDRGWNHCGK